MNCGRDCPSVCLRKQHKALAVKMVFTRIDWPCRNVPTDFDRFYQVNRLLNYDCYDLPTVQVASHLLKNSLFIHMLCMPITFCILSYNSRLVLYVSFLVLCLSKFDRDPIFQQITRSDHVPMTVIRGRLLVQSQLSISSLYQQASRDCVQQQFGLLFSLYLDYFIKKKQVTFCFLILLVFFFLLIKTS